MSTGGLAGVVIDALVALWGAELDVPVVDGPGAGEDVYQAVVIVGYDGVSVDGRAGSWTQRYANVGPGAARDETGEVLCSVFVQSGDGSFAELRGQALGLLGDMSAAVRADPTLGVDGVLWVELAGVDLFVGDADGQAVRLAVRVGYAGRV